MDITIADIMETIIYMSTKMEDIYLFPKNLLMSFAAG